MIRLNHNGVGEALVQICLGNGWSVSVLPHPGGTASLVAWDDHSPRPGKKMAYGGGEASGDELLKFMNEIASCPPTEEAISG